MWRSFQPTENCPALDGLPAIWDGVFWGAADENKNKKEPLVNLPSPYLLLIHVILKKNFCSYIVVFIVIYKPSVWCPLQLAPFKRIKWEAETTFRSRNNDLAILYIWNTILPISSHPFLFSLSQFLFLPTLDHLPFHCPVRPILSLLSFPIFPSCLPLLPSHSHPPVPTFNSFCQPFATYSSGDGKTGTSSNRHVNIYVHTVLV